MFRRIIVYRMCRNNRAYFEVRLPFGMVPEVKHDMSGRRILDVKLRADREFGSLGIADQVARNNLEYAGRDSNYWKFVSLAGITGSEFLFVQRDINELVPDLFSTCVSFLGEVCALSVRSRTVYRVNS